ncbi:hypothetical protein [Tenacibaculum agarivorans]|uniref:hypothetical protein n=1 Tax=Tenacibaculum agarivorans TaxID=1908389 RepID=UPI00094BB4CE|nr:hypothetical protein [Tenacibaculum agarivorans]
MKNLEKFKDFEISREKSKDIKAGYFSNLCLSTRAAAGYLRTVFKRCPFGCVQERVIWIANLCEGREPWDDGYQVISDELKDNTNISITI